MAKTKTKTSYEEAIKLYKMQYGVEPTVNTITNLWHRYAGEWKHFDGFVDWLAYQ
jgi:hypothetical protein